LDPGVAFGTGTHPTTALCLEWLDAHATQLAGKYLIDYGCGSGILSIAALKLGAAWVLAVDHDPQALEATRNNAVKNHLGGRLTTHLPTQICPQQYDILLANILAEPLIELASRFHKLLKPGGRFVLSGILAEQCEHVAQVYAAFARLAPVQQRDDWILLHGKTLQV
jgi:ribosomal protein L11 methyltransferase